MSLDLRSSICAYCSFIAWISAATSFSYLTARYPSLRSWTSSGNTRWTSCALTPMSWPSYSSCLKYLMYRYCLKYLMIR